MTEDAPNPKNRGLGRGLDAIFGEDKTDEIAVTEDETVPTNEAIGDDLKRRTMPIDWLKPSTLQPRKFFDEAALDELAKSIYTHGILQPIVVRPISDQLNHYEIIAGERRWRAAQQVQLHEVPVVIQYLSDEVVLEVALIENLQREDLNPIEEAYAMDSLMKDFGHTQEKLAASLGKSRSHIANTLRLLSLPATVQNMVVEGDLSAGHARNLVGKQNALELAQQIVAQGLSVRDVEKLTKEQDEKPAKKAEQRDVNILALEEEVSQRLGLKVHIKTGKTGKGSLKIDYNTLDQLDDVIHRLCTGG